MTVKTIYVYPQFYHQTNNFWNLEVKLLIDISPARAGKILKGIDAKKKSIILIGLLYW